MARYANVSFQTQVNRNLLKKNISRKPEELFYLMKKLKHLCFSIQVDGILKLNEYNAYDSRQVNWHNLRNLFNISKFLRALESINLKIVKL